MKSHSLRLTSHSHHMLTMLLDGKLFLAPVGSNPQQVLDVGTGTGIWAMHALLPSFADRKLTFPSDFGDEFPSATITGTDLSPIQPTWVPPNVKFEIDDAQIAWTWADNWFDFVHLRCLMGSIKDWPHVYREAFRQAHPFPCYLLEILGVTVELTASSTTKPGGYIEHLDFDIQFTSDDGTVKEGDTMYDVRHSPF